MRQLQPPLGCQWCWLSLWLLLATIWLPSTCYGQTSTPDANLVLGDAFSLSLGGGALLTVEAAQAACNLQLDVLVVCVQAECPTFVDVCPASNGMNATTNPESAEDTICTTYTVDDCCMTGCATELQTLAICVAESTTEIDGQGLSCGVPSCNSDSNPANTTETTNIFANSTNAPTTLDETTAPTTSTTSIYPSGAPTSLEEETFSPTIFETANNTAPTLDGGNDNPASSPSPTSNSSQVPDSIQVPTAAPLVAETTIMPTQLDGDVKPTINNSSNTTMSPTIADDSWNNNITLTQSPTIATQAPYSAEEEEEEEKEDWLHTRSHVVSFVGAFVVTLLLIVVLICTKSGEQGGMAMPRHEHHPLGRQAQSRDARGVV